MSSFLLTNILDVGRACGRNPLEATPESVRDFLLNKYVNKPGARWTYDPAMASSFGLFQGVLTIDQAIYACLNFGNPRGRIYNAQAVECIGPYALENPSVCYRISRTAVVVGRTHGRNVYVGIKAPMVRVAGGKAYVVLPGFRKTSRPVGAEIDLACSIALATFGRDDYESADFEYLDAGNSYKGKRVLEVHRGADRRIYTLDELDFILGIYVGGISLILDSGIVVKDANLRGYRIIDPDQPSMF